MNDVEKITALRKALKDLIDGDPIDSEWGTCSYCLRSRHEKDCPLVLGEAALNETAQ